MICNFMPCHRCHVPLYGFAAQVSALMSAERRQYALALAEGITAEDHPNCL
jgi:hypothetical protein